MADKTHTSAAIQPAKTIDDVAALLKVDERTSTGKGEAEGHDGKGGFDSTPWIGYRSNKAKARIEEMNAAGVQENAYYLFDKGIIAPKPFHVVLISSFHFYSQVDDDSKILDVSDITNAALGKQGFADHLIGIAAVRMPGALPMYKTATFSQRKAMTRSFDDIRSVVSAFEKDASGREWKARGQAAAAAFDAAKWPKFSVRARIWGKLSPPSKPGGRDFNLGLSSIEPTPVEDVKALNRYFGLEPEMYGGEDKKNTEFAAVLRSFLSRRAEVLADLDLKRKNAATAAKK